MKSINKKGQPFTFEDFEKGLMLAGYLSPQNAEEVREREAVQEYEKKRSKEKSNTYFKRTVLAAEIADQLHSERTFGRVKFQKLVFLCEHTSRMGLNSHYSKFAAGPFDNSFMHSINKEFKRQKWFNVVTEKNGNIKRAVYCPMEKAGGHKRYYNNYFNEYDQSIQKIINIFRRSKTDQVELVATIYACWLELIEKDIEFNEDNLFRVFYSWAKEKEKFSKDRIKKAVKFMREEGLHPV